MIKYRLHCAEGHEFEGWFASSASYDGQVADGRVACPQCDSRDVGKSIMAPNIAFRGRAREDDASGRYLNLVHDVTRALIASSEDVGDRFPEEARKIHYSEVERRAICGTASADEARSLIDEGVEIMALPRVPEEAN